MNNTNEKDIKFDLQAIDLTFQNYKKGQIFEGVVVVKHDDGVVFNIGGKNDAFIPRDDFEDFASVKIGDRFFALMTGNKTEGGLIEASKSQADSIILGNQNANKLKVGSKFSFVPTSVKGGLISKMGDFRIFVPAREVSLIKEYNLEKYIGTSMDAIVIEIDHAKKEIIASVRILAEQIKEQNETSFFRSMFVNKVVTGVVKKIMPYGAFVDVEGVDCFVHISNLAYERVTAVEDVLKVGASYQFKIISIDYEAKKVELSLKAMLKNPKLTLIEGVEVGQVYTGIVIKLLQFGAIIKLNSGLTGLLHISNATDNRDKKIYEIVKVGEEVNVKVLSKNEEELKVSFALVR